MSLSVPLFSLAKEYKGAEMVIPTNYTVKLVPQPRLRHREKTT